MKRHHFMQALIGFSVRNMVIIDTPSHYEKNVIPIDNIVHRKTDLYTGKFKFHWTSFLWVRRAKRQHCFRQWLDAVGKLGSLPDAMMTRIRDVIWRHRATMLILFLGSISILSKFIRINKKYRTFSSKITPPKWDKLCYIYHPCKYICCIIKSNLNVETDV